MFGVAADHAQSAVLVFNKQSNGNLKFAERISMPLAPDNIEPDAHAKPGVESYTLGG